MSQRVTIYWASDPEEPIRQCEIFTNLVHIIPRADDPETLDPIIKPYVVLLTQSCDLHKDYSARNNNSLNDQERKAQLLPFLIFVEFSLIGEIHDRFGINAQSAKKVKTNQHERYQYLSAISAEEDLLGDGIDALVGDFRRSFSIQTEYIYRELARGTLIRRAVVVSPYLEHISSRFAHYIARVALPEPHNVE